jgi:hypothetical protein
MEDKVKIDQTTEHTIGLRCHAHNWCHGYIYKIIKIIIILIVLVIVFLGGVATGLSGKGWGERGLHMGKKDVYGVRKTDERGLFGYLGKDGRMMGGVFNNQNGGAVSSTMGYLWGNNKTENRLAGVITKINNTELTLSDNAGKEQLVLVDADTIIYTDKGEIGINSLKVGQFISLSVINKDSKSVAQIIRVSTQ